MPTVMLTAKCMNSCEWCFAQTKMEKYHAQGIDEISWEDFQAVVAFYGRSGMDYMTLLGGEPTLHSRFMDILELLASKQFTALVVTNGICDEVLVSLSNLLLCISAVASNHHCPVFRRPYADRTTRYGTA